MTALAQAHRIAKLEHELQAFEAELTRYAEGTMPYRHAKDRVDNLRRDLERARAGKLRASD